MTEFKGTKWKINLKNIQFIFNPEYWFMHKPYNKEVDDIINELLDKYEMTDYTGYTVKLGNTIIWIENAAYTSVSLYGTPLEKYRPSRLTIKKALNHVDELRRKTYLDYVNKVRNRNII